MSTKLRLPLDVTWEKGQTCCNAMDTQTGLWKTIIVRTQDENKVWTSIWLFCV